MFTGGEDARVGQWVAGVGQSDQRGFARALVGGKEAVCVDALYAASVLTCLPRCYAFMVPLASFTLVTKLALHGPTMRQMDASS